MKCLDCNVESFNRPRCFACYRARRVPQDEPPPPLFGGDWFFCICGAIRHLKLTPAGWRCRACIEGETA